MTLGRTCLLLALVMPAVCTGTAQAAFPGTNGRIAYVWDGDGDNLTEIHTINPDGTEPGRLTDSAAIDRDPAWSPDGRKVAFTRMQPVTELSDVIVMDADGSGAPHNLTNDPASYNRDPAWSPGGNAIAFQGLAANGGDIFRMNADGSGRVNLTNTDHIEESRPSWSPDGTRIAYTGFSGDGTDVYVMNADGSEQTNLTNAHGYRNRAPSWAPDGSTIAFESNRDGNDEIYLMDPDGGGQTNLTTDPAGDSAPAWSPDGTALVFQSDRGRVPALYVRAAGGTTRLATSGEAMAPDWQPLAGPKGNVTVTLELVDSGGFRFDLYVGSQVVLAAAGDGGSGTTAVDPGSYSLGPDPGLQNTLSNYLGSTSCTKNGGPPVVIAEYGAAVDVAAGDHVVCTVRLVRIGHTATGTDVVVTPVDATTGGSPVRITFGTVTFAGVTTLTTSSSGLPAPSGFAVSGRYYELSTTAEFDDAEVCFEIVPPSAPTIAHWTGDPPAVSTPATYYRDAAGAIAQAGDGELACAVVTSFSPFALLVPDHADEDALPPVISCDPADGAWYGADVSIDCTAEDDGSGLRDPGDAAFSLSTSVPAGSETGDARTGSRLVCDRAGNCATAGPVAGNKVDRKAPALALPADKTVDATSPAGATVGYDAAASDGADPDPVLSCTPATGSVFTIGTTTVDCRATDHVGNSARGAFAVTVLGAKQQLTRLVENVVKASRLNSQIKAQLLARLEPLVAAFDPSDPARRRIVCAGLATFQSVVRLLAGPVIPSAQAAAWIADAVRIRAVIGC